MSLTDEQTKAIDTVEKLMRVAGRTPHQEEAASFTAKAMAILAAHNLDVSIIEQGGGAKATRTDEKMAGGLYKWQRSLWKAIAELNFCFYWNQYVWDETKTRVVKSRWDGERIKKQGGYRFQHRVVGRKVNVVSTKNMADYLEQTIERLTREKVGGADQFFTAWAIAYREGIADEVINKIYEERASLLRDDAKKQRAAEKAQRDSVAKGSTSTALSLNTLAKSEYDANADFLYGEGFSAKRAAERVAQAEADRVAEEEYTAWAKANPEEAKAQAEARRKAYRSSWNAGMGRDAQDKRRDQNPGAYRMGREVGKSVSIHRQAENSPNTKRLK